MAQKKRTKAPVIVLSPSRPDESPANEAAAHISNLLAPPSFLSPHADTLRASISGRFLVSSRLRGEAEWFRNLGAISRLTAKRQADWELRKNAAARFQR